MKGGKMTDFKEQLKAAKTLEEIFALVNQHYDTTKPLGFLTKQTITSNIDLLLTMAKATKK